jgi:hypothetical protein
MEATMTKTFVTMTALGALMIGSAVAQTSTTPTTPQPSAPSATSTMPKSTDQVGGASSAASSAQVVTSQRPDQMVASKFHGTDVLGVDNKKIGDVSDILFDQNGQIHAFIVTVGGFLGMGSKYIALPPSAFQVVSGDTGATTTGSATGATAAAPDEKKLKINMTEEQLKQAATFEYYKEPSRTATPAPGGRPVGAPSGMTK